VVLATAGEGAMGIVVRAHDPKLGRTVALKLLRARTCSTSRARLVREAQALARVCHPNVVAVYDVDSHAGEVHVAMEFVPGRPLDAWLLQRPRSWREILCMYVQAGRGLQAAHDEGIVHRDFKPANVIVGDDSRPRVVDFGLACGEPGGVASADAGEQITTHGMVLGTPAYMAPEQHFGEPLGPAADQFAFCVALWEALHGARPFVGWNADELARAKARGRIAATAGSAVPAWIVAALCRGLAPDPAQRWPSMTALLEAVTAPRPRRPWLALAAALAGALSCATVSAPGELGGLLGDRAGDRHAEILRDEVRGVVGRDVLEAPIDRADLGLVEHVLGPLHGERGVARDLAGELERCLVQRGLVGQHAVDETDALGVGGVEVTAREHELARDPGADDPRQPLQRARVGDDGEPGLAHAEDRVGGGEPDVARGRDLEPAAETPSVHGRDHGHAAALEARDRPLHAADQAVQLSLAGPIGRAAARRHRQLRHHRRQIEAGRERSTGSGEDDRSHVEVDIDAGHERLHLVPELGAERVELVWIVELEVGDRVDASQVEESHRR
jgi:hypothetical protein